MRSLANIGQLGIKELRSLWHDKILLFFVIWAFSIGIYAASTSTSTDLHNAPIGVVDEDQSPLSNRIINAFYGPYFKTPELIGLGDIDPVLDKGLYTFIIDIPPGFQGDVLDGKDPEIQLNVDATRMTQAFIGSGYIQNIITGEVNEFVQGYRKDINYPVGLTTHMKFNPNLNGVWFGSVMEIIQNITLLSVILAGAALIREREHGTLEHLLVMPLTPFEIMVAKVWSTGLVVLVGAGLSLYLVVQGVLQVPVTGSLPLFFLGAGLYLFSTTSLGIFLGTLARSMPQFGLLMILVILPLQILSGGITPRESMPDLVQVIMQFTPTPHFVSFAQAILYRGAGFDVVWPEFLWIIVIGVVFFGLALMRFRRSIVYSQS